MSGFTTTVDDICGYYPYLQHLGLYIAYTARTLGNSAGNVDSASSIRSTKYFQNSLLFAEGEACRENRQNSVCFLFRCPTKLTIRHVLMNTRCSKSKRTAVRITRTCVENRKATSDKRQTTRLEVTLAYTIFLYGT